MLDVIGRSLVGSASYALLDIQRLFFSLRGNAPLLLMTRRCTTIVMPATMQEREKERTTLNNNNAEMEREQGRAKECRGLVHETKTIGTRI